MSVETAIYGQLHTASEFQTGSGRLLALPPPGFGFSIYHLQAPQQADYAYIVFNMQSGTPVDGMKGGAGMMQDELWTVKGVDRQAATGVDLTRVKAIADRIDSILADKTISIGGGKTQIYLRRERQMPTYAEREEDQYYVHAGSVFRLVYQ